LSHAPGTIRTCGLCLRDVLLVPRGWGRRKIDCDTPTSEACGFRFGSFARESKSCARLHVDRPTPTSQRAGTSRRADTQAAGRVQPVAAERPPSRVPAADSSFRRSRDRDPDPAALILTAEPPIRLRAAEVCGCDSHAAAGDALPLSINDPPVPKAASGLLLVVKGGRQPHRVFDVARDPFAVGVRGRVRRGRSRRRPRHRSPSGQAPGSAGHRWEARTGRPRRRPGRRACQVPGCRGCSPRTRHMPRGGCTS